MVDVVDAAVDVLVCNVVDSSAEESVGDECDGFEECRRFDEVVLELEINCTEDVGDGPSTVTVSVTSSVTVTTEAMVGVSTQP